MRVLVLVVSLACGLLGQYAQAQGNVPNESKGAIPFQTVFAEGDQLLVVETVRIPGKTIQENYTVKVPIKTNQGIVYRTETRARVVPATQLKLVPIASEATFASLDGKPVDRKALKIPEKGLIVVVWESQNPLPEKWKQLLRDDSLIMRLEGSPK